MVIRLVRHTCNNANTESHANISFDDICIARCKDDICFETLFCKCSFQCSFAIKTKYVTNEWVTGKILQRQFPVYFRKFVPIRNKNNAIPVVSGNLQKVIEQIVRTGRDRKIDIVPGHHVCDLIRGSLVQIQADLRVLMSKFAHYAWKNISRLCVRCGNRQCAFFFLVKVRSKASDLFDFFHDSARSDDNLLAGACYATKTFPLAAEQLQAELFLKQLELLADPGLRCIQSISGRRNVEAIIDYR